MDKLEFLKRLRELIAEGNPEGALDYLSRHIIDFASYFSNDIIMLNNQFNSAKSQFLVHGIIANTNYDRTVHRVSLAVLELADKIEKKLDWEASDNMTFENLTIPKLSFDFEFDSHQSLQELEDFLNDFEYNLKSNQKNLCQITFAFEKIIRFELEVAKEKRVISRIKNILLVMDEVKNDLIEIIKLVLNKDIYFGLTDNKKNQAIVLRSLLYFFIEPLPSDIYGYVSNTGLEVKSLTKWDEIKNEKSKIPKENIFLSGRVLKKHTKIDVYNNKLHPPVIHSIWLNEMEYDEFEKELEKDRDFGKTSKLVMLQFPGENTFDATLYLSQNVLYQKAIPKAIWNTYWKMKHNEINEDQGMQSLNFGLLYVGLG